MGVVLMRQLGKQGLDQDRTLGMTRGPVAVDPARAAERQALTDAQAAMQQATEQIREAVAAIEVLQDDAAALWQALHTVTTFVREVEPFLTQDAPLPDAVQEAMTVLVLRNHDRPVAEEGEDASLPHCPECVAGKHQNCTGEVLADKDGDAVLVPCGCGAAGHLS